MKIYLDVVIFTYSNIINTINYIIHLPFSKTNNRTFHEKFLRINAAQNKLIVVYKYTHYCIFNKKKETRGNNVETVRGQNCPPDLPNAIHLPWSIYLSFANSSSTFPWHPMLAIRMKTVSLVSTFATVLHEDEDTSMKIQDGSCPCLLLFSIEKWFTMAASVNNIKGISYRGKRKSVIRNIATIKANVFARDRTQPNGASRHSAIFIVHCSICMSPG